MIEMTTKVRSYISKKFTKMTSNTKILQLVVRNVGNDLDNGYLVA